MLLRCPQFSIRTLLLTTTLVAVATPVLITVIKSRLNQDGFVILGDSSKPSDNETRVAMRKLGYKLPSESVNVFQEKIADYVDPATRIPVLGRLQRNHKHYRCGFQENESPKTLRTVIVKRSEVRWLK